MKLLKKMVCAAVLATSMGVAHAESVLNNWVFNPTGGGFAGGQRINEYLDVNGNAFIQLTPGGGTSFSFTEHAVFNIAQADSNFQLFPVNYPTGNITAMFDATGTGTFGGAFTFTGGTIRMFQNPTPGQYGSSNGIYGANLGNEFATFTVMAGGGGMVDASGSPVNNGQVTVMARASAGSVDSGYFFRENGEDLALETIMAFAFTNANTVAEPTTTLVSEVACEFAQFSGNGCNGTAYANTSSYFFVSNNGQFKLSEVPEPGSLALFGIALLGAGMATRKRAAKV
ncbi:MULTISPECIES: flocculation-associated PEP-CTERM protein PepA [unclassified Massilia]|uniref:flocculation-associated PEP-CTERM protein PepA n=1 Tax=unclassified Massilia TaxID=2609279 RepID=UPI0017829C7B|nr:MULTISPECIES: flocculation-associated PEP-CTERM protein PepA [unclassified Massilia]MBD8528930.1 flocculation-associated PEP-CTERM protein PepA [Massilia sp. CFBP 13647]MBD8673572.1 flocculation-associated PEP-CTERM protein PepA [Massilia sp. CFBP 13721]